MYVYMFFYINKQVSINVVKNTPLWRKRNISNICFHVSAVELAIDTLRDSNENTYIKVTLPGKNFLQANDCQKILLKKNLIFPCFTQGHILKLSYFLSSILVH